MLTPCWLQGCKHRPAPLSGQIKVTKPGFCSFVFVVHSRYILMWVVPAITQSKMSVKQTICEYVTGSLMKAH